MTAVLRALVLLVVFLSSGCATNPVTGKKELSLISAQQEIAIGEQQYGPSQQSQGGQYYLDPNLNAYISEVGHSLAKLSHQPELPYEFVVLNNGVPNAWALPGGKIAINRGLLVELQDEAELAAVLGHEIVHVTARHSASRISRGTLVGLTAQMATIAAASQGYGQLGNLAAQLGGAAFMARYGRDDELEADQYGIEYMAQAGYDPQAAVRLQETFVRLSNNRRPDFLSGLFASHPPSQKRVEANRQHVTDLPGGETHRQRYQAAIAQLIKDAPAYEAQNEALKALKNKDPEGALGFLDEAIRLQPDEAQFWEMRGHAWGMQENYDNAEKAYSTAIRKNADHFSPFLYRGITRYQREALSIAKEDLNRSYELFPTAVSAYYLGDIYVQQGNSTEAARYLQQAVNSQDKELATSAYNKLARIEIDQAPHKYILSKPFLNEKGFLYVALKNSTDFAVADVRVQLQDQSGAQTMKQRYRLKAGQQIEIRTGIGPFEDPRQAQGIRSQVTAARPAR